MYKFDRLKIASNKWDLEKTEISFIGLSRFTMRIAIAVLCKDLRLIWFHYTFRARSHIEPKICKRHVKCYMIHVTCSQQQASCYMTHVGFWFPEDLIIYLENLLTMKISKITNRDSIIFHGLKESYHQIEWLILNNTESVFWRKFKYLL